MFGAVGFAFYSIHSSSKHAADSDSYREQKSQKSPEQRKREINDSIIMEELFGTMTGNPDSLVNNFSEESPKN